MNRHSADPRAGQALVVVVVLLVVVSVLVPALITWTRNEARWSVKQQKSTRAFSLAEAGVERGVWKLKSSTGTWLAAASGLAIAGYGFDVTYSDVAGGTYRIAFSSGPGDYQVTVSAEGRDIDRKETRAIQAIYQNQTIPGPLISQGTIQVNSDMEPHWGPIMAQNNITLTGAGITRQFPRKFSKQVVTSRDVNGLTPPNTDSVEWWSNYPVSDLPLLDFQTMRASAAANGTLNYYNGSLTGGSTYHVLSGYAGGAAAHGGGAACNTAAPHTNHFYDSMDHPKSKQNLIWYWDGDVTFTGDVYPPLSPCHRMGLRGTIVVRGNLTIDTEDCYAFTGSVPAGAWREYQKSDTASTNQYPGDNGLRQNRTTFDFGGETWTGGGPAAYTDVGFRGFIYVGGNITFTGSHAGPHGTNLGGVADTYGAMWVVGNVVNNNTSNTNYVWFDAALDVPVLNVVLARQSWKEVSPSAAAWP